MTILDGGMVLPLAAAAVARLSPCKSVLVRDRPWMSSLKSWVPEVAWEAANAMMAES